MAIGRPVAGGDLQQAGLRPVRLRRLRHLRRRRHDGGRLRRGRVARRAPEALQPLLDLRRQPDHDRGQHRPGLHRGRRQAVRRLRLARPPGRRRQRHRRARQRARGVQGHERPADVHHRPEPSSATAHPTSRTRQAPTASRWATTRSRRAKQFYGWPEDEKFLVPDGVYEHFQRGHRRARQASCATRGTRSSPGTSKEYPELADELDRMQRRQLPDGLGQGPPDVPRRPEGVWHARQSSSKVLNVVAKNVPWLIGGAADLAPSTQSTLTSRAPATSRRDDYGGRNLHFGVREHAMAARS